MKDLDVQTISMNHMKKRQSAAYQALCTEYYELDKPHPPIDALAYYSNLVKQAKGPILEPMCGSGRFLIPLVQTGADISGFDTSEHMLNICKLKCQKKKLQINLILASFANFHPSTQFKLVYIPSGSFCLLTDRHSIEEGLSAIAACLEKGGKFVFEVDTIQSLSKTPGIWQGNSVIKPNGQRIVLNTCAQFNTRTRVSQTLCRYELWDLNAIVRTEVEEFNVRLYELKEIEQLLKKHNLAIVKMRAPYTNQEPDSKSESILFECVKC